MKVRATLVVVCVLGAIAASTISASAVTPVVVVSSPAIERYPAASTTFIAWTRDTIQHHRFISSVMAEPVGGTPFRVSSKGGTGGIDGSTLIYGDGQGDIALFDLSTKTALPVPNGVNTNANESALGISGTHLLFARFHPHGYSVVLFDTSTGTSLVVYSHKDAPGTGAFAVLQTAQLNGNYAAWDQYVLSRNFTEIRCDVTLYDIAAATLTRVPNPNKRCQSGPAVSADGTLYFDRSGLSCGQHARIIDQPLGGTGSVLYSFPKGHDYAGAAAVDNGDGTTDVYFDPLNCRRSFSGDIYKLPGV